MSGKTTSGTLHRLRELLEPSVDALGYELVQLDFISAPSSVLRVYIDAPGGIRVDDCAKVSRRLSAVLDADDAVDAEYSLEVSSPGLDRPLVLPAHFQRFCGHLARIVMKRNAPDFPGLAQRRKFCGRLVEASEHCVVLEVDGESVELAYADIDSARLEPTF